MKLIRTYLTSEVKERIKQILNDDFPAGKYPCENVLIIYARDKSGRHAIRLDIRTPQGLFQTNFGGKDKQTILDWYEVK